MSYTVLARKYRSQTFDDLVGQEVIATTLKNAVKSDRVHHGYLFTGTRGVGKTSAARVLAKALNCMASDEPTPTPCCQCESCRMIAEGEDIDVIEIDAASNTGVDNIRDLRDNTAYRPARARFKIYIIDEVHMLSTGAFNALLKTLEEPPDYVKFILATTEIHKVPATIVSRCQRFDFKSISVDAISGHLNSILEREEVRADEAAVRRVARVANGSMRDALSVLDQLLSFGGGALDSETLDDVLPVMHDEVVAEMFDHVADEDAAAALLCVERSLASGQTIERYCEMMVTHLRTLMLMNLCGGETDLVDLPAGVRERLSVQSGRFDAATYVYMIGLSEEVRRSVKTSNASRALLDAAVVRLALAKNFSNIETLLAGLEDAESSGDTTSKRPSGERTGAAPPRASRQTPAGGASNRRRPAPAASQPSRASPPPEAATAPPKGAELRTSTVSSADEARARNNPDVAMAMDLFDGTLMSVERGADQSKRTQGDAPAPERAGAENGDETPADGEA